jgi:shikimate dehydrogenase
MAIAAALVGAADVLGLPAPAELALFDAQPGRAAAVAARLGSGACAVRALTAPEPAGYDLIINATPLGLNAGDALPLDPTRIDPGAAVVDILMKEADTPLVRACRARGLAAWPGHEMLVQQVGDHLRFFGHTAVAARVEADLGAVRALIQPAESGAPRGAALQARAPSRAVSLPPAAPAAWPH